MAIQLYDASCFIAPEYDSRVMVGMRAELLWVETIVTSVCRGVMRLDGARGKK